jgi:hypothetical protein
MISSKLVQIHQLIVRCLVVFYITRCKLRQLILQNNFGELTIRYQLLANIFQALLLQFVENKIEF